MRSDPGHFTMIETGGSPVWSVNVRFLVESHKQDLTPLSVWSIFYNRTCIKAIILQAAVAFSSLPLIPLILKSTLLYLRLCILSCIGKN